VALQTILMPVSAGGAVVLGRTINVRRSLLLPAVRLHLA
jgi:hypothetical protein